MSRLGQGTLGLRSCHVGTVWVSGVTADVALQPRLKFSAGCQLHEVPAQGIPQDGLRGIRIATLGGQLRWQSETGPVIGDLSFPKGLEHIRSTADSSEHQFTIYCDVPLQVLGRLEAERAGASPVFWMDLAGSWALDGGIEPIYQRPWQFAVPTEAWLSFLSESGYGDFDVVEVRRVLKAGGSYQGAVDYLSAARDLVSSDPPAAVGKCRLVIEALEAALKENGHGTIADHLFASTDGLRAKQYTGVVSSIKQLAALKHHHFGQESGFKRPEALALARICEALLVLLAELAPPPDDGSGDREER